MIDTGKNIYIGTAGWSYPDWQGIVYPENMKAYDYLPYLSRFFNTVEINSSFYAIPSEKTVIGWIKKIREKENFLFILKLYQGFTHKREKINLEEVKAFKNVAKIILDEGRLGGVLVQFPWSFKPSEQEIDYLKNLFDKFYDLKIFLEIRNRLWLQESFFKLLDEYEVTLCNIDQPVFNNSIKLKDYQSDSEDLESAEKNFAYVRLHGRNKENWFKENIGRDERYDYLYSEEEINEIVRFLNEILKKAKETFVITNNHFQGKAVCNALQIASKLFENKVNVPENIFNNFPQLINIAKNRNKDNKEFKDSLF